MRGLWMDIPRCELTTPCSPQLNLLAAIGQQARGTERLCGGLFEQVQEQVAHLR